MFHRKRPKENQNSRSYMKICKTAFVTKAKVIDVFATFAAFSIIYSIATKNLKFELTCHFDLLRNYV